MQVHALRQAAKEPLSVVMNTPNKAVSDHRSYIVKATSGGGFVKCKGCAKQLCSDSIKLGVIHSHADGFVLVHWYHLSCLKCPTGLAIADIEGTTSLRDAERERVRLWAADSESPAPAKAVTPATQNLLAMSSVATTPTVNS